MIVAGCSGSVGVAGFCAIIVETENAAIVRINKNFFMFSFN